MSAPMSATEFVHALVAEGLDVVEHGDWKTHNRNHMGAWGPVYGVMIHHTVTRGTASTVAMCQHGYTALPGPLCHGVIAKDGRVHLVGYGRANHAGLGDPDVLRAVIAEKTPPADNAATVDGNRHFYGFECENLGDGKDPWPEPQLLAIEKAAAAICRHHDWDARSVIRHLDWQPGKVDPRGPGMDWSAMQARLAKRLGSTKPPAPSPPKKPSVSLAKLVAAARTDPARKGTPVTYSGTRIVEAALVDAGLLAKTRLDGHFGSDTVRAYAALQRQYGYSGKAADGIPGKDSLTRLGAAHGFTATT